MRSDMPTRRRWRPAPQAAHVVPWTLGAVASAVALRVPFVAVFPRPDEGGLLEVARHWHSGGPQLYGGLFLDRPPLLVLFWRLANVLGGVGAARWLAMGAVALLIVCAAWAGHLAGGPRGARWAALATAAFATTPLLGSQEVDGELLAVPLVMLCCALVLTAVRQDAWRRQVASAFGAGVAGGSALLVKQNFADGLVFAAVLVVATGATRASSGRTVVRLLVAGVAGAALPVAATMVWAVVTGPGLEVLWYSLYGFRFDAGRVIADHSLARDEHRVSKLVAGSVLSGLVPLLLAYLWLARRRVIGRDPVAIAVLALLTVEVVGVALGGSYWLHYLIGLVPSAALAASALPGLLEHSRFSARPTLALVVGSALAATLAVAAVPPSLTPRRDVALAAWLRQADRPGDTGVVVYGVPNILEASGLRPARYPYLWTLELRTEDPRVSRLRRTLAGRSAPTWVVERMGWNTWRLDPHDRLRTAVHLHYRRAATVCGSGVFLRDGVSRALPAVPHCGRSA